MESWPKHIAFTTVKAHLATMQVVVKAAAKTALDALLKEQVAITTHAIAAGAGAGIVIGWRWWMHMHRRRIAASSPASSSPPLQPDVTHAQAHAKVWGAIGGAMQASQMYIGDALQLYETIRIEFASSSFTVLDLASITGFHARWLREWAAQQAAAGILALLPGDGDDDASLHYRLVPAYADVLGNPRHKEYDAGMIQAVPSLVWRAKRTLTSFRTGLGCPYDDTDISTAIDRGHDVAIEHEVIPRVMPMVAGGRALAALERGIHVADLGCGGGGLLVQLAQHFPRSTFVGYEISEPALARCRERIAASGLHNLRVCDGRIAPLGSAGGCYELVVTYDVLHDATDPLGLAQQVRRALTPGGVWLMADINSKHGVRANVADPKAALYLAFSVCLCMSSALSEAGGAGLGTLGLSVPVAKQLLNAAGFGCVGVLTELKTSRWYEAAVDAADVLGAPTLCQPCE